MGRNDYVCGNPFWNSRYNHNRPAMVQYSLMAVYIGFSPIVSLGLPVLRYTDILRNFK